VATAAGTARVAARVATGVVFAARGASVRTVRMAAAADHAPCARTVRVCTARAAVASHAD
jgi:hypothetical protein